MGFESVKTKAEISRFSGIRIWDYKKENLENKNKQELIMEESSKKGTGPRRAVLPDTMRRRRFSENAKYCRDFNFADSSYDMRAYDFRIQKIYQLQQVSNSQL
ncbi:hypothetical protein TNCV_452021 [Trichonephila clavipes]|nr:hypothetical protein TNCV_452021 [Trichonephila clavipes]